MSSRQIDAAAQPFEFETGMGILPEAIDLTGMSPEQAEILSGADVSTLNTTVTLHCGATHHKLSTGQCFDITTILLLAKMHTDVVKR